MRGLAITAVLITMLLSTQQLAAQQPSGDTTRKMMRMDMRPMRLMDSMNARLDTLVGRMNRATGNAKVTAMAQVINELVSQRRNMHAHMRQMMRSRGMMKGDQMMMQMGSDSAKAPPGQPTTGGQARRTDSSGHDEHHQEY